jgi:hypothetical protein
MNVACVVNGPHVIVSKLSSILTGRLGEQELWLWGTVTAAIGYWGNAVINSGEPDPLSAMAIWDSVVQSGAFTVAAWIMIVARAPKVVADRAAPARGIVAALGIGVLCALPFRPAVALAVVLLAAGLLRHGAATRSGRQTGWLLACVAGVAVGGFLGRVHVAVAGLDAHVVAGIWRLLGGDAAALGNTVTNGGFELDIYKACASSFPLPQVVLAFVVVAIYRRGDCRRSDLPWVGASLLASVVLTELRLTMMARGEADYLWLHDGSGVTVYALAAMALAVLFPWCATSRAVGVGTEQPA